MHALGRRLTIASFLLGTAPAGALDYQSPYGRLSAHGYIEGSAVMRVDPDTPQQLPQVLWDLKLTADPSRKVRFFLETRIMAGGPPQNPAASGFQPRLTFRTCRRVEFMEGWVDVTSPAHTGIQVRVGPARQLQPPTYSTPAATPIRSHDEQDAKLSVPALQANWYRRRAPRAAEPEPHLVWVPVPSVRFHW
jgi:hypothetical protein